MKDAGARNNKNNIKNSWVYIDGFYGLYALEVLF